MSSINSRELYPEINPYKESFIKGDDTHEIFVEESGNPEGRPILFLHGGPGGGTGVLNKGDFLIQAIIELYYLTREVAEKANPLGETLKEYNR